MDSDRTLECSRASCEFCHGQCSLLTPSVCPRSLSCELGQPLRADARARASSSASFSRSRCTTFAGARWANGPSSSARLRSICASVSASSLPSRRPLGLQVDQVGQRQVGGHRARHQGQRLRGRFRSGRRRSAAPGRAGPACRGFRPAPVSGAARSPAAMLAASCCARFHVVLGPRVADRRARCP